MSEWEKVAARLTPQVTRAAVGKILYALMTEHEPWQIFARARVPFPFVVATLRALYDGGWLEAREGERFQLTARGEELTRELHVAPGHNYLCPVCGGSGVEGLQQEDFFRRYVEIFERRPQGENPEFDQASMTPASLARRLAWMIHLSDVAGKEVVVLGDDDLLSIALALTRLPARVATLEIDERLCEYISTVAQREQLAIEVIQQDLCQPLRPELHGRFDTFACDPPEAEDGMLLFLDKALTLLAPGDGHAGYFGVTMIESSTSKWARWQKHLLNDYALALTHMLPPFTEYINWVGQKQIDDLPGLDELPRTAWYRSSFYRVETLPEFQPTADFNAPHTDALYLDKAEGYYTTWANEHAGTT